MTKTTKTEVGRRDLLKALGVGAPAAAVAATAATLTGPVEARETVDEAKKARYQPNSAHVQAYYRTNRY